MQLRRVGWMKCRVTLKHRQTGIQSSPVCQVWEDQPNSTKRLMSTGRFRWVSCRLWIGHLQVFVIQATTIGRRILQQHWIQRQNLNYTLVIVHRTQTTSSSLRMPTSSTSTTRFHSCEKRIKVEDSSRGHGEVRHSDEVRLKKRVRKKKKRRRRKTARFSSAQRV